MHTSSVMYHRLYFRNIALARNDFAALVDALGLKETDRPDVFDLVFEEGSELTVQDAIVQAFPEHILEDNVEAYEIYELTNRLVEMGLRQNVVMHTPLFKGVMSNDDIGFDLQISAGQLFDLINILSNGFEIIGIFSEWSVFSNRSVMGAHSGGSSITTRQFILPTNVDYEGAENMIKTFSSTDPEALGDYYVEQFIKPMMGESIISEELQNAVFESLRRLSAPN